MRDSIMPNGMYQANGHTYYYSNQRYEGTHRHEVFFGTANRKNQSSMVLSYSSGLKITTCLSMACITEKDMNLTCI